MDQAKVRDWPPGMSWAGGFPAGSVVAPVPERASCEGKTLRAAAPPVFRTSIAAMKDWPVLTFGGTDALASSCAGVRSDASQPRASVPDLPYGLTTTSSCTPEARPAGTRSEERRVGKECR